MATGIKGQVTKEQVAEDIKRVGKMFDDIPTSGQYKEHGNYNYRTAERKFESWSLALKELYPEYKKIKSVTKDCKNCGKQINVVPSKLRRRNYCSHKCSNSDFARRKMQGHCRVCLSPLPSSVKYCCECKGKSLSEGTIRDVMYQSSGANKYGYVRYDAKRRMDNSDIERSCKSCGYDKYVHICHIRGIHSFPRNTLISEVNSPENLAYLCPNCHWELDHGELEI